MEEDLEPGYFDIPEPKTSLPEASDETALLLVPGVGFDPQCHRLWLRKRLLRPLSECSSGSSDHRSWHWIFRYVEEIPSDTFDVLPGSGGNAIQYLPAQINRLNFFCKRRILD